MLKTELKFIDDFCKMNSGITRRKIIIWLWIGFAMILIQIILGAVTRLTGSGLSITRWDIITGIIYPFSQQIWNDHFDLYKQTPQFSKINQDMSLSQFKFIFFWEYLHRLWARLMGFVFLIPFVYFLVKKQIDRILLIRLIIIICLACIVASLGWIMVVSGLIEKPWVNAYKLSFHLITAIVLLSYLFYTILKAMGIQKPVSRSKHMNSVWIIVITMILIQIFGGGVMAGMKAGLAAPTWPEIQGKWIPDQLFEFSSYKTYLFTEYELSHTGPIIIQFFHRSFSYILFLVILVMVSYYHIKFKQKTQWKAWGLLFLCLIQIFLGVWTVIHCIGYIPLWPAVFHQFFGISLLIYSIWLFYSYDPANEN